MARATSDDEETGGDTPTFLLETDESIPKIEEMKREAVERAYELCDGNVDHAASSSASAARRCTVS